MKRENVMPQLCLASAMRADRTLARGVETGLRHHKNTAHRARPPASPMLLHERVPQRDSLAKKAVDVNLPLPLPRNASAASFVNLRTQVCNISGRIPSARATCDARIEAYHGVHEIGPRPMWLETFCGVLEIYIYGSLRTRLIRDVMSLTIRTAWLYFSNNAYHNNS